MRHSCHAINCPEQIPPRLFMCCYHWSMVPKMLQQELWRCYRPGQERDKHPSQEYRIVATRCQREVKEQEEVLRGEKQQ